MTATASDLARSYGFPIFPLREGVKNPPPKGWREKAIRDPATLEQLWRRRPNKNIGIKMGSGFLAIDVDARKGGVGTLGMMELEGRYFPRTWRQRTPGGGFHLIYWVEGPCPTTVEQLGPGVDTRGDNGYIAGPGSTVPAGEYVLEDPQFPALAPAWLHAWCEDEAKRRIAQAELQPSEEVSEENAVYWAREYLAGAPVAVEGEAGDDLTYRVACHLRDLGLEQRDALELMATEWNPRCSPPWEWEGLSSKVANAYRYARNAPGSKAPENEFEPVAHEEEEIPEAILQLNREYALVTAGGGVHIIWEPTPQRTEHLSVAAWKIREKPRGKWPEKWLKSADRRAYDGIGFHPDVSTCPQNIYNTWRGFTVIPLAELASAQAHEAVDMWFDHARKNVCHGDERQFRQLVGFFAHMVQKPQEKPRIALVLKGEKGVGKNVLVESFGRLLGSHFTLAASRRYLTGNFNSHLENCLFIALDEAYWAGDKEAEATLKDLVTGTSHRIERKGSEPYEIANYTRVVIIGNEEWIVPATHDERRFSVFTVGNARKQDTAFFEAMMDGLKSHGGYALLLQRLMDPQWLEGLDLNTPLQTEGLKQQKHQSLTPFEQWWYQSIAEGRLLHAEMSDEGWPKQIEKEGFRVAFRRFCRERNIRSRFPSDQELGQRLKRFSPTVGSTQVRKDKGHVGVYRFAALDEVRAEWDSYLGHTHDYDSNLKEASEI